MDAFSDGVFAIAITLLILEIAVPAGSERDLWNAVLDEWPSYSWLSSRAVDEYHLCRVMFTGTRRGSL